MIDTTYLHNPDTTITFTLTPAKTGHTLHIHIHLKFNPHWLELTAQQQTDKKIPTAAKSPSKAE
ncbi:hypothetical protein DGMP_05740 [Desulfomarina profundi]|uniref:Uncharacterized protein n=1 Tax=Desulfomarina profundi TaxID=2772557 RepID=A0A8D5FFU9_9BACT|nr:hypothetical protein DGMP_05740 [Desulfomarina profundi]